ncbi:MAG: ribbon-helix-helix domain-containing protein [Pseudomonadota bacterium]
MPRYTVRVTDDMARLLSAQSEKQNIPVAELIRDAVAAFVTGAPSPSQQLLADTNETSRQTLAIVSALADFIDPSIVSSPDHSNRSQHAPITELGAAS